MAAEVTRAYYGWPHEGLPGQDGSQGPSVSTMQNHGSVTFGRFAVETLSWEKRSMFSFDSRQEELERCSARGLVSQRRAYFEEFYKNLRANKAPSNKQPRVRFSGRSSSNNAGESGEENKRDADPKNLRDGVAKIGNSCPHGDSNGATLKRVKSCNETVLVAHLDLPTSSSSNIFAEEFKKSGSGYAFLAENLDAELSSDEVLLLTEEKNSHHGKNMSQDTGTSEILSSTCDVDNAFQDRQSSLDDKILSEKYINSSFVHQVKIASIFKLKTSDETLLHSEEKNSFQEKSTLHDSGASEKHIRVFSSKDPSEGVRDERNSLDKKILSEKDSNCSSVHEANKAFEDEHTSSNEKLVLENYSNSSGLGVKKASEEDTTLSTMHRPRSPNFSVATETNSTGHKKECTSVPKTKDLLVKDLPKMNYQSKSLSKSSYKSDPVSKNIGKPGRSVHLNKTTADKHSSTYMSNPVDYSRSLRERQLKPTVPCPFSFATEKRAAGTSGLRDRRERLVSKPSNGLTSSTNHAKGIMILQGTSRKETTAHVAEGRDAESRCNDLKARTCNVLVLSKARSLRTSQLKESDWHSESDKRPHVVTVRSKAKEGKAKGKATSILMPKVQHTSSRKAVQNPIQNDKKENKKVMQSQSNCLSLNIMKAEENKSSFHMCKQNRPKPQWR